MIVDLKPYPRMKDSGVPWLGEVPEHWQMELAKWLFSKMDRPVQEQDEVVTCFRDGVVTLRKNRRIRGFTESLKEIGYQGVRRGDLVIHAMDAFAGAIGVSDSDGKGTPVYSVCEPAPRANAYYYAYMVREMARSQWIQALAKGIRERSTDFRFDGFGSQSVPVPPILEQGAIVRYLDYMDRRIRKYIRVKQKLIKLLQEQKQTIIHRAVTRGLDPNVRLNPSGVEWLGEVPEHWEVLPFMRLFDEVYRYPTYYNIQYVKSGVPEVRGEALVDGKIIELPDQRFIATETNVGFPRTILREGDLVMSVRGTMGKIGVVGVKHVGANITANLLRLSPRREVAQSDYLSWLLRSAGFLRELDRVSPQTTIKTVTMPQLAGLRLCVPPLAEQKAIVTHVDVATLAVNTTIHRTEREIDLLREYRTRLIADVVTGKLDVREAAANLPEEAEVPEALDEIEAVENSEEIMDEGDGTSNLQEAEA